MKKLLYILVLPLLFNLACKTTANKPKPQPNWVHNRPVNTNYYIGIGAASKLSSPTNYQQVAKKNALNDLVSEIKVTVTANSALYQFQQNNDFKQQFESETKLSTLNSIESFESIDNWEDAETYWTYYRLSKAEYEEVKRRKVRVAMDRASDYFMRANAFDINQDYMPALRLKMRALVTLQDYLNEDLQTVFAGKTTYLVNEILTSIQEQLYHITIKPDVLNLKGQVGKALSKPLLTEVYLKENTRSKVAFAPLRVVAEDVKPKVLSNTACDQYGLASIYINKITSKKTNQLLRIELDLEQALPDDSSNASVRQLLYNLDIPSAHIKLETEPVKFYFEGQEQHFSKSSDKKQLESALKTQMISDGCLFVATVNNADYVIKLHSNTTALGAFYGKMQSASIDVTISVIDSKNNNEVFKDALSGVKGYQTTQETAGVDAYKNASEQLIKNIYPKLQTELFGK